MFKTLLVPVDGRPRSVRALQIAGRLAQRFDAHVVGLYVQQPPYVPPWTEGGTRQLLEVQQQLNAEAAAQAKARFDEGVRAAGIARAEWRVDEGPLAETVALHARYADLVVVNQTNPEAPTRSNFADTVIMEVGRPVLVVPYVGEFATLAEHVLVAWNASREAARAVTDALPLLREAKRVTVLSIVDKAPPGAHGEVPGADIALYLARHGVRAEAARTVAAEVSVGDEILSRAFDYGADLIVMGAYGHSRAR
ncbi:MAG: universal stress protein, partial [Burkholderiaceae bacterium]|nr:universal stress protein [Burkholderiaceae bacterium]